MEGKQIAAIVAGALVVLLLIGILPPGVSIMTSVPAGSTGILTTYGRVEDTALSPGMHFKLPWQRIVVMDNRIQTMRIASGVANATTSDTAETKDQQLVPVFEFEIQYQLNTEMSYIVYSNYGTDYTKTLINSNALQFIKETFAQFNAEEIVTSKSEIPAIIRDKLAGATEPHGINIVRVNMVTYDFSPEYTAILEERALLNAQLENNRLQQQNETIAAQTQYEVSVKNAEREAETKRIATENANAIAIKEAERNAEIKRIEAENANAIAIQKANAQAETDKINAENSAYVTRTKAEAERDARLAVAEAEKAELEAKAAGLNEYVIQQEFIARWDGKLIPSFGGGNGVTFANLTDIIGQYLAGGEKTE